MELLPDDVVAAVLSLLVVEDLMQCRLVCRRFRDLSGRFDVWRHRQIFEPELLRLSPPCCRGLYLMGEEVRRCGFLAATTTCATTFLNVYLGESADIPMGALVVRNQAGRGRLRSLSLSLAGGTYKSPHASSADLFEIYSVLLGINGLLELDLKDVCVLPRVAMQLTGRSDWPVVAPSLQKLEYRTFQVTPIFELLLRRHAPTLREVHVTGIHPSVDDVSGLLMNLTHLRELTCPLLEGMYQLLQCRSLRVLRIVTVWDKAKSSSNRALCAARFLLRCATYLRRVILDHSMNNGDEGVDLVRALGESGVSEVTCLEIDTVPIYADKIWEHIISTLPKLPCVEKLVFHSRGSSFMIDWLSAIRPEVAPKLRQLHICGPRQCVCCSKEEIIRVLELNRQMRLIIPHLYRPKCSSGCGMCTDVSPLTYSTVTLGIRHVPKVWPNVPLVKRE
ncbi:uncharacterized protein LOC113205630 [Frankliniella occidentalis]|uniref:Uncharacterized protein LOC113205630 n=1 Tax=Frankliniella occidentalis TaxID=133901 RepID=A0A6J1S7D2_FRAOC|nr:uncharacterized protein LOC113205630 [Frankliniella occidentalis]